MPDTGAVAKFCSNVDGCTRAAFEGDFILLPPDGGRTASGICFARGANAKFPPQWLVDIVVEDPDGSVRRYERAGGAVIDGPRAVGPGRIVVIRDPAGAVTAHYERSGPT
ncbi:MAG: hypothetical protein L3K06_03815 [Thermoplasmata archaeon]|nr:hypothetical protein [Thermoplasmata archaeon]